MWQKIKSWQANIHATLNIDSTTVPIDADKAALLAPAMHKGECYFLTLQAGFDVEIVKLVTVTECLLIIERAQQGTQANVWPAGTPIVARIPAKLLAELHLDKSLMLGLNHEVCEAPNGDVITKL